jgi:hypothetical protein
VVTSLVNDAVEKKGASAQRNPVAGNGTESKAMKRLGKDRGSGADEEMDAGAIPRDLATGGGNTSMVSRFREKEADVKPSIKRKASHLTSGKYTQAGPVAKKQRSGIKEKTVVDLVEDEVKIIAVVDLTGGDSIEDNDEI